MNNCIFQPLYAASFSAIAASVATMSFAHRCVKNVVGI